jgi:glycosyltransferase involved in cell wall biosynthesis
VRLSAAARRDAYLPTPVRVAEADLARLAPIALDGCPAARVLVRREGRPLGWVTAAGAGAELSPLELLELARAQLGPELEGDAAARLLEPGGEEPAALPPASIVVCTRDRADRLARCLRALLALDYPAYEVVVVDNAPRDDAAERVARALPVRYVREPTPGLDWARNRGIAESRHELVAFTDDDAVADRGWLRGVARAFADPDVAMVTGLVAPLELGTEAQLAFEMWYGGMGKGFRRRDWRRDSMRPSRLVGAHHLGVGANMAFRRSVLRALGPFDTALDVGTPSRGGGDLEMFHRVLASGMTARYEPSALVWHEHRREMAALRRQLRDNGRAFGVYLLTLAARRTVPRGAVAWHAAAVWLRWMAARVAWRLLRRELMPIPLQAEEWIGAATAPGAFLATRRHDRRVRRAQPPIAARERAIT